MTKFCGDASFGGKQPGTRMVMVGINGPSFAVWQVALIMAMTMLMERHNFNLGRDFAFLFFSPLPFPLLFVIFGSLVSLEAFAVPPLVAAMRRGKKKSPSGRTDPFSLGPLNGGVRSQTPSKG